MSDQEKKVRFRQYQQGQREIMLRSVMMFLQDTVKYIEGQDEEAHAVYYRFPVEEGEESFTEIKLLVTPDLLKSLLGKEIASLSERIKVESLSAEEVDSMPL